MLDASAGTVEAVAALVGCSRWTTSVQAKISQFAAYDASVLITGPTGTGKELIAQAIHKQSSRAPRPFIPVDCTTLTGALFSSQLFGHRKGAFTGAEFETLGCFRAAHGGTIFLDEIGDLELELQAKLLRVLQERTVVPVGAYDGVPIDVRVLAATNRDLKRDVVDGRFREDLFFRLNAVMLETSGLKDRSEDIAILSEHFLEVLANSSGLPRKLLSPSAVELLTVFDWPGNVRQLQHVLEQAVIVCEGTVITLPLLQELLEKARMPERRRLRRPVRRFRKSSAERSVHERNIPVHEERSYSSARNAIVPWKTLSELELEHICVTMTRTYQNQTAAAALLGISRPALIRKLKRHGIAISRRRHSVKPSSA